MTAAKRIDLYSITFHNVIHRFFSTIHQIDPDSLPISKTAFKLCSQIYCPSGTVAASASNTALWSHNADIPAKPIATGPGAAVRRHTAGLTTIIIITVKRRSRECCRSRLVVEDVERAKSVNERPDVVRLLRLDGSSTNSNHLTQSRSHSSAAAVGTAHYYSTAADGFNLTTDRT